MSSHSRRLTAWPGPDDVEGTLYAIAPTAVLVAVATEDGGTIAVLAGGRAVRFAEDLHTVASWFSGDRRR